MADNLLDIVPTRAMLQKGTKVDSFKAIVVDTKPRKLDSGFPSTSWKRDNKPDNNNGDDNDDLPPRNGRNAKRKDDTEFDMKRARHEVIRFGSSGFEVKDKKRADVALAVKLGAVPPKREYKNYKDLLAEKKRLKDAKQDEQKLLQLGKNQMGVSTVRCRQPKQLLQKKKRAAGDLAQHYGVAKPKIFKKKRRN